MNPRTPLPVRRGMFPSRNSWGTLAVIVLLGCSGVVGAQENILEDNFGKSLDSIHQSSPVKGGGVWVVRASEACSISSGGNGAVVKAHDRGQSPEGKDGSLAIASYPVQMEANAAYTLDVQVELGPGSGSGWFAIGFARSVANGGNEDKNQNAPWMTIALPKASLHKPLRGACYIGGKSVENDFNGTEKAKFLLEEGSYEKPVMLRIAIDLARGEAVYSVNGEEVARAPVADIKAGYVFLKDTTAAIKSPLPESPYRRCQPGSLLGKDIA